MTTLIGVDVGGTGVKAARVDLSTGAADGRERIVTPQPSTPDAVAGTVREVVGRFDTDGPIGCTMPAVVMHGVVRTASNIDHAWIGTDARALFADDDSGARARC